MSLLSRNILNAGKNSAKTASRHFLFSGFSALVCIAWLLSIPADSKNSLIGQFSTARLAMAGSLFAAALLCLAFSLYSERLLKRFEKAGEFFFTGTVRWKIGLGFSLLLLSSFLFILFVNPDVWDRYKYAVVRLQPILAWLALCLVQILFVFGKAAVNRHPEWIANVRADFKSSQSEFWYWRSNVIWMGGAILFGSAVGLVLFREAQNLFALFRFVPYWSLGLGIFLLLAGLFYNRSMVRAAAAVFVILLAAGSAVNLSRYPADSQELAAAVQRLPGPEALALGQTYHYSLSLYHILSILYPKSTLTAAPGLLEDWGLNQERLHAWVPVREIEFCQYDAFLTDEEVRRVDEKDPIEVEVNTLNGSVYYRLLPALESDLNRLVLAYHDRYRYFLPKSVFDELFDREMICPR